MHWESSLWWLCVGFVQFSCGSLVRTRPFFAIFLIFPSFRWHFSRVEFWASYLRCSLGSLAWWLCSVCPDIGGNSSDSLWGPWCSVGQWSDLSGLGIFYFPVFFQNPGKFDAEKPEFWKFGRLPSFSCGIVSHEDWCLAYSEMELCLSNVPWNYRRHRGARDSYKGRIKSTPSTVHVGEATCWLMRYRSHVEWMEWFQMDWESYLWWLCVGFAQFSCVSLYGTRPF